MNKSQQRKEKRIEQREHDQRYCTRVQTESEKEFRRQQYAMKTGMNYSRSRKIWVSRYD